MNFVSPNNMAVSALITSNGSFFQTQNKFPEVNDLTNCKVIAIESYCSTDAVADPVNGGVIPLGPLEFNSAFVTLYTSNQTNAGKSAFPGKQPGLFYDQVAMYRFRTANNSDTSITPQASFVRDIFIVRPTIINWKKSFVGFPNPTADPSAGATKFAACFLIHYLDVNDNGDWWLAQYFGRDTVAAMTNQRVSGDWS